MRYIPKLGINTEILKKKVPENSQPARLGETVHRLGPEGGGPPGGGQKNGWNFLEIFRDKLSLLPKEGIRAQRPPK